MGTTNILMFSGLQVLIWCCFLLLEVAFNISHDVCLSFRNWGPCLDSETTYSPHFHKMAGISWKISTLNSEVEEEKTEEFYFIWCVIFPGSWWVLLSLFYNSYISSSISNLCEHHGPTYIRVHYLYFILWEKFDISKKCNQVGSSIFHYLESQQW